MKDFLNRPYPLVNQDWSVSASQFSTLWSAEFPDAVLGNLMYSQKFSGFLGIRADLKFRLQINSQPFQAGRLILAWVPYYKYLGQRVSNFDDDSATSMVSLTGCPHIQLDLSQHTEADLCVPYASNQSFFNFVTGEGYYGKLYLKVYSVLTDPTGSGSVDYTLWFNFDNISLGFPTGSSQITSSMSPDTARAQVGNEERQVENTRTFAAATSKFASALRTIPPVPALDSILQPAAWASDALSDVLRYFGLSKLESTNVPNYIKQNPCHFMPNSDGVNLSHSLSLLSANAIEGMPDMGPEKLDEMALKHLTSTPTYLTNFSWSTSAAAGSQLYSQPINPCQFRVGGAATNTFTPTMLMFVSSAFTFWRGSLRFTFKFVKTKFHSGRVRVFFQPGLYAFGASRQDFNYSQIIDLRSETEVSFTVPYINTKPWCMMETGSAVNPIGEVNFTGVLYMEVLNELRANSSVAATINVLVEVSGGEDYELAAPASPLIQPVLITSATSTFSRILRAKAQVGEEESREQQQVSINSDQIGNATLGNPWALNLAMHGEKILSLRQLIKRSSNSRSLTLSAPGGITIAPFSPQMNYSRTASGSPVFTPHSFLDYFQNLYVFWRGSVNLKIIPNTFEITRASVRANLQYPNLNTSSAPQNPYPTTINFLSSGVSAGNSRSTDPVQVVFQDLEGCIDVTCPYYSLMHMSPVSDYAFTDKNVRLGMYPPYLVTVSNLPPDTYTVYRSAADSYQLAYLIGPPLCELVTG